MIAPRVGQAAPDFDLPCVSAGQAEPHHVKLSDYSGRWLILIFYPQDFTFVCPTELTAFSARAEDFGGRDCEFLGISGDSIELHQEWLNAPPSEGGLGPLQFPLGADLGGTAARAYGVWIADKEVCTRGLFIVDPDGILQYAVVHNLSVGRSPDEVLRVLDALRTQGLCPASWTSADGTIDPENALQPGRILGHYRIRRKLGVGTFGTVFAAWDLRLERMVALKVLKRKVIESRDAVLAEARTAAKVSHPHVCTIYAVEEEEGLPVIAMEYLDGRPLSQAIADGLEHDLAVRFAVQIAEGLAAAHHQDVIHGDLKPANVMVTEDNVVRILDFGLARSQRVPSVSSAETTVKPERLALPATATTEDDPDATIVYSPSGASSSVESPGGLGIVQGTPAYMSPEHALGLTPTSASDVYSFGLMLFEMLTCRRAISERPPIEWILKLQTEDMASALAPQVGESHRDLLAAMLCREPASRPVMREVVQTLVSWE